MPLEIKGNFDEKKNEKQTKEKKRKVRNYDLQHVIIYTHLVDS